jgi:hypothetical protein
MDKWHWYVTEGPKHFRGIGGRIEMKVNPVKSKAVSFKKARVKKE